MAPAQSRDAYIRRLTPLARLAPAALEALLVDAPVLEFRAGEIVYSQDEEDDFVHYLLEGVVEALWNGRLVKSIDVDHVAARRPLDPAGPKRYTLRARTDASILRVTRSALERQLRAAELASEPAGAPRAEVRTVTTSDWMTRLLQSELFTHLPPSSIQQIFERMEEVKVRAGDVVVRQGDVGEHYYVIETGQCEVTRRPSKGGSEVHLADLGPGLAFGEEALIAGMARNATVRMRTDGRLMRLDGAAFRELIRDPLIHEVSYDAARALIAAGGAWLDIRYPEQFAGRALEDATNIPLTVLRAQCDRLDRGRHYVVCSDDPRSSAIGAFLLAQRGFRASFLSQSVSELPDVGAAEGGPEALEARAASRGEADDEGEDMNEQRRPAREGGRGDEVEFAIPGLTDGDDTADADEAIPRDLYAETAVGKSLADLIEDMGAHQRSLEGASGVADSAADVPPLEDLESVDAPPNRDGAAGTGRLPSPGEPRGVATPLPPTGARGAEDQAPPRVRQAGEGRGRGTVPGGPHDELSQLMRELEQRVREHIEARVEAHRERLEQRLHERVAGVKQAAAQQIRKNAESIRQAYERDYAEKRSALRRDYERLIRLANKVSRQKAEIQHARRDLEDKLKIANELHREVDEIRRVLTERIGNIEGLESGGDPAGHPL